MRKKRLAANTIMALVQQVAALICGFILPRLILQSYGSKVNGLVSSISQFLSVISFLELGVGPVLESALYKPLAEDDMEQASRLMVSGTRFFRMLAGIFLVYMVFLVAFYPSFTHSRFDRIYISALIVSMGISSFAQYYFGISSSFFLVAAQKGYILYFIQSVTLVANIFISALLIHLQMSIQTVKLVSSIIFLLRPIYLYLYIQHHYKLNWKITYAGEPIEQKWNGVAQHIASVVLYSTDTIVLTAFSSFTNVSIYSVYHLILNGLKTLFIALTTGIRALLGELWVKHEYNKLHDFFGMLLWCLHTGAVFLFGCAAVLIVPFVQVYTKGITDAEYRAPVFAFFMSIAFMAEGLRWPYYNMILACNHYRQTQSNYIVAAILNILLSVILVIRFGLVGVALGTLIALVYQMVWMAWYNAKNLIQWPFSESVKQFLVDVVSYATAYLLTFRLEMLSVTYTSWVILAVKCALIWIIVIFAFNIIFCRRYMYQIFHMLWRKKTGSH